MSFWRRERKHRHTFTKWEMQEVTVYRKGQPLEVTNQVRRCTECGYYQSERI